MDARREPLLWVGGLMAALSLVFGAAMILDPRVIEGAPAWLKPAKFAVSTAIYCFTLRWMLLALPAWPRVRRLAGTTTAIVFVVEVALIALQAARGTLSHFNASTPFDGAVFSVMGLGILLQTVAAMAVAVALWRQTFTDRALGVALRLGMTIGIAGAWVGGLMTTPTRAQIEAAQVTHQMPRAGAHTVGGDDGGPGLPGIEWSADHGDLRVPHFLGLHAMQALPFVALVLVRGRREAVRLRAVVGASVSYAALFLILLTQALMGQPLIAPQGPVRAALLFWAIGTAAFALVTWRASSASLTRRPTLEIA